MYEHRTHPILNRAEFTKRVARHLILALIILASAWGLELSVTTTWESWDGWMRFSMLR